MARMSREFSLVLLGAGLLTAGYFVRAEPDPIKAASDDATTNNGSGSRGRARVGHVFFFYAGSGGGSRAFASTSSGSSATSRGGFGRIGASISGG